jgi:hypothetical protein
MASTVPDFEVEYGVACPLCASAGKSSKLGLVVDVGICCDGAPQHTFEELPETGVKPSQAKAKTTNKVTPVGDPPPTPAGEEVPDRGAAGDEGEKPQESAGKPTEVPQLGPCAEDSDALEASLYVPVEAGGGDVYMLVRFSESYIQTLKAEAAAQDRTLPEFMADWVLRCGEVPIL